MLHLRKSKIKRKNLKIIKEDIKIIPITRSNSYNILIVFINTFISIILFNTFIYLNKLYRNKDIITRDYFFQINRFYNI